MFQKLDKISIESFKSYFYYITLCKIKIKLKDNEKNCSYFINDADHLMCVSSKCGSGSQNTRQDS